MTAPARFTQSDITRAMKAARSVGFSHVRIAIDVMGNMVVDASDTTPALERRNPLDRILPP